MAFNNGMTLNSYYRISSNKATNSVIIKIQGNLPEEKQTLKVTELK